jgi:Holliday junction resolvase-like predicted endonuclease
LYDTEDSLAVLAVQPEIDKSSRHSKITGDFAEGLVLYWLSKHGFECARVDHTGIDLIATNPYTNERMGISVKARSRNTGTEERYIKIKRSDEEKVNKACVAFGCAPYFAIVIDAGATIRCFVLTMDYLLKLSGSRQELGLGMRQKDLESYYEDSQIMVFEFESRTIRWWTKNA